MGKGDLQPAMIQQHRPELRHLLALGDRIGRDKADTRLAPRIQPRLDEPRADIIRRAAGFAQIGDAPHLLALPGALVFRPHKWRIAQHVGTPFRRQHPGPVHLQRVAMHDGGALAKGDAGEHLAEFQRQAVVHDVVHHPQRRFGDAGGKLLVFDAVELVDVDHAQDRGVQFALSLGVQLAQHLHLQQAQFAVGDDQEITAAAGGIEECQAGQMPLKRLQPPPLVASERFEPVELGAQIVKEQRLDHLEDVLLGGVMRAFLAPLCRVHHRLKKRAEDGRGNRRPVEAAGIEQRRAHVRIEIGRREIFLEQRPVDIGKLLQILVEMWRARLLGRVEDVEQIAKKRPRVRAIGRGARFQIVPQDILGLENAGIVGKQAEDDPHQELFELVALVSACLDLVMQQAHQLGGLDVDRVLIAELPPLNPEDEAEALDMVRQVLQQEGRFLAGVEVDQLERLEIADKDVSRLFVIGDVAQVVERLLLGLEQIAPLGFLLDDEGARPEQINESAGTPGARHRHFILRDLAALDPEDAEKGVVKALGLALLIAGILPVLGKVGGAGAHLVPSTAHEISMTCWPGFGYPRLRRLRPPSAPASPPVLKLGEGRGTALESSGNGSVLCGMALAATKCSWNFGSIAVSTLVISPTTRSISRRAATLHSAMRAPVPATYAKPFVKRRKNDKADAEAIAEAASRPTMRFVAVKSAETQGRAVAFRTHQCLVRQRTQLINARRAEGTPPAWQGHLAEFGLVAPKGPASLKVLETALADETSDLPEPVREMGAVYLEQIARLTEVIDRLADELEAASKTDAQLRRLCTIPGIGPVTAGAVSAFAPALDTFNSGRNFAAWLGLVPRQRSTGGKTKLGSVSKMGQTDIRRLLIVGAMSVIRWVVRKGGSSNRWLAALVARKPRMVAAVALANKMARMIWAMTTKQENYRMA